MEKQDQVVIQPMSMGVSGKKYGCLKQPSQFVSMCIWRALDVAASKIPIEAIHFRGAKVLLSQACM